ncbi:hypothetical protein [Kribbella sp. C-35]|uniref:hypothetical protein n=1 Tax=Kribbella sp. C-35 TaxID=2789276 RepID=UPI00397A2668
MKNWLAAQPQQPAGLDELQTLIDTFVGIYNHTRPHRSLPHRATPATAYQARPKAGPGADRSTDTHYRVLHDIADSAGKLTLRRAGRLHHVPIGTEHARPSVLKLVDDLHIRIINAATGELLRELTLDPTRNYQPLGRPPGPPKKQKPDPR